MANMKFEDDVTVVRAKFDNDPDVAADIHLYIYPDGESHIIVAPDTLEPSAVVEILEKAIEQVQKLVQ